jgi:hypothetical protein
MTLRFNPFGGGISLNGLTDDELKMLAVQTGVSYEMLKTQQRAEMASAGSTGGVEGEALIPTVELKLVTNAKNPRKARKKNITIIQPRFIQNLSLQRRTRMCLLWC